MNLNDVRLNAYKNQTNSDKSEKTESENKKAVIKPFEPIKLTKNFQNEIKPKSSEKINSNPQSGEKAKNSNSINFSKQPINKNETSTPKKEYPDYDNTEILKNSGLLKVPVAEKEKDGRDSIYRRVAKFLVLIGEEEAAKILPHLSEAQIERIVPEIASIRTVSKEESSVILAEFKSLLDDSRKSGGIETARDILKKAYGEKRAEEMLEKSVPFEGKVPFHYLNDSDDEKIYQLLKDESAGIQAIVVSYLKPKKAASVINLMKPDEKKEIVLRLAKMEPVSPEVIRRVDNAMHEKSLHQTSEKAENIDGRNVLAQILKKMSPDSESEILENLSEDDPDLGEDLRSRLFTIEDVINSDDRFVQETLRKLTEVDIVHLVAGKSQDFREKILSDISSGRRMEVLDQEKILKPLKRSECEKVTSNFFSILRRAFDEGHLIIKDRNDDVFI